MLRPHKMSGKYDASVELGTPAEVNGDWVGLRCDKCGHQALPGRLLEVLSEEAVLAMLTVDRCLSGNEAKFLRKAALGVGQEELARRLGITRVTVARWEGRRSLSAEHDFELRSLVMGQLLKTSLVGPTAWKKHRPRLVQLLPKVLEGARPSQAPARPPPLRIAA